MHQTRVDRYVRANQDVWRVVCDRCGVLADDVGRFGAVFVEKYFARKECTTDWPEEG